MGIGPNTTIFSVVWATLLAPLPNPEADKMVVVWMKIKGERNALPSDPRGPLSPAEPLIRSRRIPALGHSPAGYPGDTEPIKGGMETPGWSTVSGLGDIALGRDFSASYVPERRGIKVDPMIALRQE